MTEDRQKVCERMHKKQPSGGEAVMTQALCGIMEGQKCRNLCL